MKRALLIFLTLTISTLGLKGQTPLSMNGKLKLVGNQLSNACGDPVQLRGISTHTPMGFQNCYTESSVATLANDWGSDVIRLAMYTDVSEGTDYIDDPTKWNAWIDQMVDFAEEYGMYVILDWHILEDEDPMEHIAEARTFFETMSNLYKDRDHVIYEICNEPNGWVDWNRIREYATDIIPRIRANDPDKIIIVGTPGWSSRPGDVFSNQLPSSMRSNVMYAYHFYAGSHYDYDYLKNVLGSLPIFVSEWGTTAASGNWGFNEGSSNTWLNILDGNNAGGVTVSSCNWSFSDKNETSAALNEGSCASSSFNSRTQSGNYVYDYLSSADNFTQCEALADDDNDGVINAIDECPNTPPNDNVNSVGCTAPLEDNDNDGIADNADECPNTTPGAEVNIYGCEILQDFVNNSCQGVNNYQGYVRDDFEIDGYRNVTWWSTDGTNTVYDANYTGSELEVDITAADPTYQTFGLSFGEDALEQLVTVDISHFPKLTMDVEFTATGPYSEPDIILDIQIEDAEGNKLNTDALKNVMRIAIPLNTPTKVFANFEGGFLESWEVSDCGADRPCYFDDFDFTKLTKVIMWVNPGAGESWSRPEFTGTWTIDNFSIGYDEDNVIACTAFRDDDGDGVAIEDDWCPNTPESETVNVNGCGQSQLDDDRDGVNNVLDACPETSLSADVDASGCAQAQLDDDVDGVNNPDDECDETPQDELADEKGCSPSQLDDDNDGVMNDKDQCPNSSPNELVDVNGCELVGLNAFEIDGLRVFPIPAEDQLHIEQVNGNFHRVSLISPTGAMVASSSLTNAETILPTDGLQPGLYLLRLSAAESIKHVKIMIK